MEFTPADEQALSRLARRLRYTLVVGVVCAAFTHPLPARAQATAPESASQRAIRGRISERGAPLPNVNVFDVQTLDGAITSSAGTFSIPVHRTAGGPIHLAARKVGYRPFDTTLTEIPDSLLLILQPVNALARVSVLAGRYTADAERTATLSPIEVMTTPGGGDVNSAVKTLPGVQNVDDGRGLFVRGGDYTETRTFIDGAPMFTAYQFAAPTGSVAATINPFLTDGITFSAGGFGARWGNTLSGIVDLRPQGRPQSTYASVNATLLSVGAGAGVRLAHGLGASATVGFSDLSTLLAVNGNPRGYSPAPHGNTESAQGVWEYSGTGRVTVFGLRQTNAMGILVQDPAASTMFYANRRSDIVVASLRDTVGRLRPFLSISTSGLSRGDSQAVYRTVSGLRTWQARAESEYAWSPRVTSTIGVEDERLSARYAARTPVLGYDPISGSATTIATLERTANRDGEYAQVDAWPLSSLELVAGIRTDRSGFASRRTTDPRVSVAWHIVDPLTLTASWGRYHQVADPAVLDEARAAVLPALADEMAIVGAQFGEGDRLVRLEGWRKRYGDLVGLTRNYIEVDGMSGRASGFDLFARSPTPFGTRARLTWSAGWSRRGDPNTSSDAPAPFDITHSITAVLERDWSNGWHVGIAQRFATGRPFTDVVGATFDTATRVFAPTFAAPNAERLPAYRRADVAVSRARSLSGGRFFVIFGAIQNPFNRTNIFGYTWTHDYSTRVAVPSAVNRTLFIGANFVQGRTQ